MSKGKRVRNRFPLHISPLSHILPSFVFLFFIHFLFDSYLNTYLFLGNAAFFAAYTQTKIYITRKDKENRIKRGRRVELDNLSRGNIEDSLAVNARDRGSDRGSERGSDGNRIEGVSVGENRGQGVEFLSSITHCARINSNSNSGSGSGSVSDNNSVSAGTNSGNNNNNNNNNKAVLVAGAMAGLAYVLSSHPLEIASILMQIDVPTKQLLGIGMGQKSVLQYR